MVGFGAVLESVRKPAPSRQATRLLIAARLLQTSKNCLRASSAASSAVSVWRNGLTASAAS